MSDIDARLGRMEGALEQIMKNTDHIPDMNTRIVVAEKTLKSIVPTVRGHQRIVWGFAGISGVCTAGWAIFTTIMGAGHG